MLLCEDGGGVDDDFGPGERLMGLTPAGETYIFAKNNIMLTAAEIRGAGKSLEFIDEGDYRQTEWAGATFDPSGPHRSSSTSRRRASPSRSPAPGSAACSDESLAASTFDRAHSRVHVDDDPAPHLALQDPRPSPGSSASVAGRIIASSFAEVEVAHQPRPGAPPVRRRAAARCRCRAG